MYVPPLILCARLCRVLGKLMLWEQIMRLDFMQRQKAWEAEQARYAPFIPSEPSEDDADDANDAEYDLPTSSSNAMQLSQPATQLPQMVEEEVDEVAQMEDRELEALLEYMPTVEDVVQDQGQGQEAPSQNLWSDDDDYEELFEEFMEQDGVCTAAAGPSGEGQGEQGTHEQADGGEVMDMS